MGQRSGRTNGGLRKAGRSSLRGFRAARSANGRRARGVLGLAILGIVLSLALAAPAFAATPAWEIVSNHFPTNVPLTQPVNEVQTVTVTGEGGAPNEGKFQLEFENEAGKSEKTKPLPYTASAAEVQAALENLKFIGAGNVAVTGGPQGGAGEQTWSYAITFVGALAAQELEELRTEDIAATSGEEKKLEKGGVQPVPGEAAAAITTNGAHDTVVYQVIAKNIAGVPTGLKGGRITVVDKLPPGLTLKGSPEGEGWSCKPNEALTEAECKAGQKTVVNPDGAMAPIDVEAFLDVSAVSEGQQLVNAVSISGAGAAAVESTDAATVSSTPASFGIHDFKAAATGPNGERYTQAGGRPYAATTSFFFNTVPKYNKVQEKTEFVLPGNVKDADVTLPAGFVGNPLATARCPQSEFTEGTLGGPVPNGSCPPDTQVGTALIYFKLPGDQPYTVAVYNLQPPAGVPAEFGFIFDNVPVRLDAHVVREATEPSPGVREAGEYRVTALSADINEGFNILGVSLSLWGVPADSSHNPERFKNGAERGAEDNEAVHRPFLTNPVDCLGEAAAPPQTTILVDSWERPGQLDAQGNPTEGPNWLGYAAGSPAVMGCDLLKFNPTIAFESRPSTEGGTTQADEPSGYKFSLEVPQNEQPTGLATPELRNTTVTLPEGLSISPSAANGLEACSDAQIDLLSTAPGSCPAASQVGTVEIKSQLLTQPLSGRVYVGMPDCSPCSPEDAESGRLFRLFIEAEGSGVRVKLAGTASANTTTGRLTTTFKNNPQLPFEVLELTLKGGPRATLANPQSCGSLTTSADLTPWSNGGLFGASEIPGTSDAIATSTAKSPVDWNGSGGACPQGAPFSPSFQAGTADAKAGAYSPFNVTFERRDREQDLSGITVQTPPGLLGKIAGIPKCEEPQASSGTCPEASRIATATSAAGAGTDPFVVSGPVYFTGPYKGAPFGLSIVVPANAGPFHLGNVIVRAAITVDPRTSALTITSDPLPQSRDGVPFRLRTVSVTVDRPEFMFNPTNCEPKAIGATVSGAQGATVSVTAPFTASSCSALSFAPTLTATTQANASKANGASLTVKLSQTNGEAHIHKVQLQLPKALPSRLTTLQKACPEAQFAANPAGCPEASVVGTATAVTPLLGVPLTGPAYLVSRGGAAFPDLVFLLQGEGVHIELVGNTDIKNGITYSKFETVPDAPISSFETTLPEGPHSVLASNGSNLCEQELLAPTTIVAQNNAQATQSTKIAVVGCPPSVNITRVQVRGGVVLVTVKLSAAGTVKITGAGLRATVARGLGAGTHQIKVALSKLGRAAAKSHKRIRFQASLTVGAQTVTKTAAVKG